jgi:uncharacterized membrane protein
VGISGRVRIIVLLAVALQLSAHAAARAEALLNNSLVEISGTGSGKNRDCTIKIKPSMKFGDDLAPQLVLTTSGQTLLSYSVDGSAKFTGMVIVQNNTRTSFVDEQRITPERFRSTLIGKALRSGKLFYLTGQRQDTSRYVSSRYEAINFDAVLQSIETSCPFDAESLMDNLSAREQAERALSLSPDDLKMIRWALNKRYAGVTVEPSVSYALSPVERNYLKSYAADNGVRVSKYLTSETAHRLIFEGQQIARQFKPTPTPTPTPTPSPTPTYVPPSASRTFQLRVCNKSSIKVSVAVSGHKEPDSTSWHIEGWWTVGPRDCTNITNNYLRGRIYLFAKSYGSNKTTWSGRDLNLCVEFPGPFDRVNTTNYKCHRNERLVSFSSFVADDETFTWTLNP